MLKKMGNRLKDQRGLTLIELLAVIVILGIIAAIAVPSINNIIQKSKEDAVKADAIAVLNAAKLYVAATDASDGSLTTAQLSSYLEDGVSNISNAVVTYSGGSYTLDGSAKAGNATITFADATIKDINDDDTKGTRKIGSGT